MTLDQQLERLTSGCVDVVRAGDLRARLALGRPLVVKVGFRKMKHFQDLGHRVVFVVGDFTALIGDPTGRSKTRPPLSPETIRHNAETYKAQVFKILDPARTVVEFNSRWLSPLGSEGLIKLAAKYNVAQMLERREFRQRYDAGQPIAVHEFLYPLVQAYDSVAPQIVMTTPLLEGLDGVEKMSKSLGNYVGVTDAPGEMFGKVMSVSDALMWRYYQLLTDLSSTNVHDLQRRVEQGELHPKRAKADLAARLVADYHGAEAARTAAAEFERVHARGELPADVREVRVDFGAEPSRALTRLLVDAGLAPSTSDAGRRIQQGGVKVNGEKIGDLKARIDASRLPLILQSGRHAVRVVR